MRTYVDLDHQPHPDFNAGRRIDRGIGEMLGLCKGVLADGVVSEAEVQMLRDWIRANPDVACAWPGDVIAQRLLDIYADGMVDPEEREDLADLLRQIVGGEAGVVVGQNLSTTLPLDTPAPELAFDGQVYVFTGKFAFGPRSACEETVTRLGARCDSTITKRTRVLVVGTFASRDWIQTSYGRKIERAAEYRAAGVPLCIVGEDHWASSLP